MQVGSAAHGQALACGQYRVVVDAGGAQGALGFVVQRDTALTAGGGLAPAALRFDQRPHRQLAVTDHLRRVANRGGHDVKADDHDAQVQARVEAFEQHAAVEAPGVFHCPIDFFKGGQVDGHPLALFAIQRLDHHRAVVFQKGQVIVGVARQLLGRQSQACLLEGSVGEALVLAQGHAHGTGQVAQ
ncbi:hypothetical protein D3C77_510630 [compost metagenome]